MNRKKLKEKYYDTAFHISLLSCCNSIEYQIYQLELYVQWLESQLATHPAIVSIEFGVNCSPYLIRCYYTANINENLLKDILMVDSNDEMIISTFSDDYINWLEDNIIEHYNILYKIKKIFLNDGPK